MSNSHSKSNTEACLPPFPKPEQGPPATHASLKSQMNSGTEFSATPKASGSSEVNPSEEKSPWVSPYITVKNLELAIAFYEKAFGFEKINIVLGEDGTGWHGEIRYKPTSDARESGRLRRENLSA